MNRTARERVNVMRSRNPQSLPSVLLAALCAVGFAMVAAVALAAPSTEVVRDLALGDADAKVVAIRALGAGADPASLALLKSLLDGEIQTVDDKQVLLIKGDTATDLLTGLAVSPVPATRDEVVINNRLRREIGSAMAALKLTSPDRAVRLAAAKELQSGADEDLLPAISTAVGKETDPDIKAMLQMTQASIQL